MVSEEPKASPQGGSKQGISLESGQNVESLFTPRFKSVAAMAGWDEEALIIASLVVEDTPERSSKHKKRSDLQFKTPPSSHSRRKRRAKRSPVPIPVVNLDEEVIKMEEGDKKSIETEPAIEEEKKTEGGKLPEENPGVSESNSALPCMDKLREELSCAICLEICFEPSTTTCGHSFCKKCLRSAANKCGKRCPKCRQLISNGRSCTVNTVLWNTIQLLFPQEVEARKAAGDLSNKETSPENLERETQTGSSWRGIGAPITSNREVSMRRSVLNREEEIRVQREDLSRLVSRAEASVRSRRGVSIRPSQDEDAALALRLQREEFMGAFDDQSRRSSSISLARANLRAMASRAVRIRRRGQGS